MTPGDVKYIAVHCSATPPSQDIGVNEIRRMHKLERGFSDIGYHHVIRRDGTIEAGRDESIPGAHVQGFNHCSIGVALVGGIDKSGKAENNFTEDQMQSLALIILELRQRFPGAAVQGHRDFPDVAKDCPSFDVRAWMKGVGL